MATTPRKLENRRRAGAFILWEMEGYESRDVITLLGGFPGAGQLLPGTVLGKITASGKFVISPATGSDGSQVAIAILFDSADIRTGDCQTVVVARLAELDGNALIFDPSVDTDAKKNAKAQQLDVPNNPVNTMVVRAPWAGQGLPQ